MIPSTTVSATGTLNLGNASDSQSTRFAIALDFSGGANISVLVKGRLTGSGLGYTTIAYTDKADGAAYTAAITADALIEVGASGLDVQIDVTVTSGTVTVYATPLIG